MKQKRRIAAGLTLLILLTVALLCCMTVIEATHDCGGIDCHTCAVIHTVSGILRGFAAVTVILMFAAAAPGRQTAPRFASVPAAYGTPVTDKVRFLN